MSIDLRFPKITGATVQEQLEQTKSYLHQMVEQLNWALKTIESGNGTSPATTVNLSKVKEEDKDPANSFNSVKALIIKSADIIDAYYEEINRRLAKEYVAQSEYGTFTEQATHDIEENADGIEQIFNNLQQITSDLITVENTLIEVNAHIRSGLLYYDDTGVPVYGLEVGQRTEVDGQETFNKYARFTANRLSFYDQNDNEVAYISDYKLYITNVEVTGSFSLGGFMDTVLPGKGVVTIWVGGT